MASLRVIQHGAIDLGHVSGGDPACVLALVRALRYNTFFIHLDLTSVITSIHGAWNEGSSDDEPSDVAGGPLEAAIKVRQGENA